MARVLSLGLSSSFPSYFYPPLLNSSAKGLLDFYPEVQHLVGFGFRRTVLGGWKWHLAMCVFLGIHTFSVTSFAMCKWQMLM